MQLPKVLWLASWYPTKNDFLTGDFFQRHAKAAAQNYEVYVIHVKRDDAIVQSVETTINTAQHLTEEIILYKPPFAHIPLLGKVMSVFLWWYYYHKSIHKYLQVQQPSFIHVKAAWRCGIIAYWLKITKKIPYVISEQYTGYFKEAKGLIPGFNEVQHFILKIIFRHALQVYPVSDYLGKRLQQLYNIEYKVLDNIIDTTIFKPKPSIVASKTYRLLHVSLLNKQKNPALLFDALDNYAIEGHDFICNVVAPKKLFDYYMGTHTLLQTHVHYLPEVNQEQLATYMQEADVFIFPSLFESFGLVPYECIACGTPVIVSDIPVFSPHLKSQPFALLHHPHSVQDFVNKIKAAKGLKQQLDATKMYAFIQEKFSVNAIAHQINELYKALCVSGNKVNHE
jgi:glycosyltransferase involved in cell wall biosynthesis